MAIRKRVSSMLAAVCVLSLAGCGQDEIQVYEVAKATPASAQASAPASQSGPGTPATSTGPTPSPTQNGASAPAPAPARVPWTVPDGWESRPNASGMRLASYGVKTEDGRAVDISVVVLGQESGSVLDNVNRWRRELRLPPITADELSSVSESVLIGEEPSQLYDLISEELVLEDKYRARTLAAMLDAGGAIVFFKAMGEAELVFEQKPKFVAWLNSVLTGPPGGRQSSTGTSTSTASDAPRSEQSEGPTWQAPAHWKAGGPRPMRFASYSVPATGEGDPADLSISSLGGDGGGVLTNLNRWRNQVGLPPLTEAAWNEEKKEVTTKGGRSALIMTMTGDRSPDGQPKKTQILAAIIPHGDRTWFLKLTGDDALVTQETEAFVEFVRSFQ